MACALRRYGVTDSGKVLLSVITTKEDNMSYIRKPPTSEELTSLLDDTADNNWQTYECELVTPLYGGGIEAGVIDEEMPIRASSIRGQLRFWWRITCSDLIKNMVNPILYSLRKEN
ncbi:MAG: type III-B CRISPR module RAMP protein Cmr1 [Reinekea sp.]